MVREARQVAVIGGGISGLTTAWLLKKAGADVRLIEAGPAVGGCMRTVRRDGFLLEQGPFNVMVRDPAFESLLDDLSDDVRVVAAEETARRRCIYRHGALHALPGNPIALATTRLLSPAGRLRLLAGLVVSRRGRPVEETLEQAATRRFGKETADTLISAAASGIYAGDIGKLTLQSCFPNVARIDRNVRSIIGFGVTQAVNSVLQRKRSRPRRWRGLVSFDGGLGALPEALGRRLGADLMLNCRVCRIERMRAGHEVTYQDARGEEHSAAFGQLVLALPAGDAGRGLVSEVPAARDLLGTMESASMVVLNLGFARDDIGHPLDGFGFLVPRNEARFPLMGVLFADSVFPHHAPADRRLLRVFLGGPRDPSAAGRSDDELLATTMDALSGLLDVRGGPCLIDICRHSAAIPQYHHGHTERIARVRSLVGSVPGLYLTGNYLEGVSLNDCIRSATRVAEEVYRDAIGGRSAGAAVPEFDMAGAP